MVNLYDNPGGQVGQPCLVWTVDGRRSIPKSRQPTSLKRSQVMTTSISGYFRRTMKLTAF